MCRKLKLFIPFIIVIFLLSGCGSIDFTAKIIPPENSNIPIQGRWIAIKCLNKKFQSQSIGEIDSIEFSKKGVMLGKSAYQNPDFLIKRVDADEYFLSKFQTQAKSFGFAERLIEVIEVSSDGNYINDFAMLTQDKMLAVIKDDIYIFSKEGSKIATLDINPTAGETSFKSQNPASKSGVLLGIRQVDGSLKTLWIAYDSGKMREILEMNDLLLPRKNGFYLVSGKNGLSISNISGTNNKKQTYKGKDIQLLFVSNDYLSVKISQSYRSDYFRLLPVDNINSSNGIRIGDIFGSEGTSALLAAKSSAISGKQAMQYGDSEENYGIFRSMGRWIVKGSQEIVTSEGNVPVEYNINMFLYPKLVHYDSLNVSWGNIKNKVPDASDAFTSPSNCFALVEGTNSLYVYAINNGTLKGEPLLSYKLQTGDSIVMAEWGEGIYTDIWEKLFLKYSKK